MTTLPCELVQPVLPHEVRLRVPDPNLRSCTDNQPELLDVHTSIKKIQLIYFRLCRSLGPSPEAHGDTFARLCTPGRHLRAALLG